MKLRTYLRLLRPIGSLFVLFQWIYPPVFVIRVLRHSAGRHEQFFYYLSFGAVVWMSPVIGLCLAGAAHELMHRPQILLLPDALRQLRNRTVLGVLIFATLLAGLTVLAGSPVPVTAAFGFAAALLALPTTSRHRGWGWPTAFLLVMGGLTYVVYSGALQHAMTLAPAAFFLGGLAIAPACILDGFSRRHLRQRIETPFRALQGMFSAVPTRNTERILFGRGPLGRDWKVPRISGSLYSWMQVVRHACTGRRRRGGFHVWTVQVVIPMGICALLLPFLGILGDGIRRPSLRLYGARLAELADLHRPGPWGFHAVTYGVWILSALFSSVLVLGIPRPMIAFPLSRDRLARVAFGLTLFHLARADVAITSSIFLVSLLGQWLEGHFRPGFGLPVLVAFAVSLTVFRLILTCSLFLLARPLLRLGALAANMRMYEFLCRGAVVLLLIVLVAAVVLTGWIGATREFWLPYVFTPLGMAGLLCSAAVGLYRMARGLRHMYRTCDLPRRGDAVIHLQLASSRRNHSESATAS